VAIEVGDKKVGFVQEGGKAVELYVFGDEFYSYYETDEGFTAVYDNDKGVFCYAEILNGYFISTEVPVTEKPPRGLRKSLREHKAVQITRFSRRYNSIVPFPDSFWSAATLRTYGDNKGLLPGRKLCEGKVRGLTVIVEFPDVRFSGCVDDVSDFMNGRDYRKNGNSCSVRDYFFSVSAGKLDYENEVVGPVMMGKPRSFYRSTLMAEEVFEKVVEEKGSGFLYGFDSRREGIIDAVNILYAGNIDYMDYLWPHINFFEVKLGKVRSHFYMLTGLGERGKFSIGSVCHETGHMLCRFPDLYDYGQRDNDFSKSAGVGDFCLMGTGSDLNGKRSPAPVCAYLRDLAGWTVESVVLDRPGRIEVRQGDYGRIVKYVVSEPNEYFVIENRFRKGLDCYLPASGLAVYHCDTGGSNEWQQGTPQFHYQCALLQADGHRDLECNVNRGDEGDLFGKVSGVALSRNTNPSSRRWDGSDSEMVISDISEPGDVISFEFGY